MWLVNDGQLACGAGIQVSRYLFFSFLLLQTLQTYFLQLLREGSTRPNGSAHNTCRRIEHVSWRESATRKSGGVLALFRFRFYGQHNSGGPLSSFLAQYNFAIQVAFYLLIFSHLFRLTYHIREVLMNPEKPVKTMSLYVVLRNVYGSAFFQNVTVQIQAPP